MKTYVIPISPKQVKDENTLPRKVFDKFECGAEAMFFKLTKKVGIKVFPNFKEARNSRDFQAMAYEKDIAPRVLSDINRCSLKGIRGLPEQFYEEDADWGNDRRMNFGYFYKTEVANLDFDWSSRIEKMMGRLERIANQIEYKGNRLGEDVRMENVGFIGKKFVLIDFGKYSTDEY